ncbi:ATP11 family protein [Aspergillus novofumigatus IBT 16806]|uniref:Putative F1F0 ATP synthase assembly protein Atp11 n=1 Tax=Aspergillus novofumigatus (strain IBT 16806) TaxID=1392255 RepID=A0A2I1BZK5_ASPN1|nr:putative F1F0 ATP synthase assembly protein Atp11 [Aspergillus novofumigatus IBT 16806]PKX90781.1 putative F1F0 ATP synthase assembly protein Atp11 [Aspergillus novofumigatus IBT 16806]
MASSIRPSAFQSLLRGRSSLARTPQRRWARAHDVRFLATHHDPNHVLDRYKSKLDRKAKEEGLGSVESLKEAYKEKIQGLRRNAATPLTPEPTTPPSSPKSFTPAHPPPLLLHRPSVSGSSTGIKPLSSYLDVEKVLALPQKEIEALWRLRHANNPNSICACIPLETYQRIAAAARHNPQFILPLPRSATEQAPAEDGSTVDPNAVGADIHFLQWAFHPPASPAPSGSSANNHTSTVIFTQLAAYKLHGAFAQPHTTITHHLDLADEKGLVLMHGQVMPDSGISTTEASWLVSCLQRFYDFEGQASGRKGELVRMFTRGDVEGFKMEELMEEAERL